MHLSPAQVHLSPERGASQKQRTFSGGVYTSLYKRIKSSINMQLYTEPNPRTRWVSRWEGGREGGREVRAREPSHLGPDEGGGGKGCVGSQPWSPAQRLGAGDFRE